MSQIKTKNGELAALLIQGIMRAKVTAEDEKFSPLQDYFSVDAEGDLLAKQVGVKIPVVTEEGMTYQTQLMPLYMLCPCRFFKVESLSLEMNAYLDTHSQPDAPQLTLHKKSGLFARNHPVQFSVSFAEKTGIHTHCTLVDKLTVDEMGVDELTIDEETIDEQTIDEASIDRRTGAGANSDENQDR